MELIEQHLLPRLFIVGMAHGCISRLHSPDAKHFRIIQAFLSDSVGLLQSRLRGIASSEKAVQFALNHRKMLTVQLQLMEILMKRAEADGRHQRP